MNFEPPPTLHQRFDVIIIGGGPRAVSTIERLTAHLSDRYARNAKQKPRQNPGQNIRHNVGHALPLPISIAIIDAVEVGAGSTWRTDQPGEYLNNTYSAETTIYPDHSTKISGALRTGPDLVAWAEEVRTRGTHPVSWVLDEVHNLQPWSYPSRRLQGVYYREQLAAVADPALVDITPITGTAVRLELPPTPSVGEVHDTGDAVAHLSDGTYLRAPLAVLAQGMAQSAPDARSQELAAFAQSHGGHFLAPGMASERAWPDLPAGETAIVQGLGANFFDVVGILGTGRGGRFTTDIEATDGRLMYHPSGREPHIVATSGRGTPYRAKADYAAGLPPTYHPRFASADFFTALQQCPEDSVNFAAEVWPTIAREFAWAYLSALAKLHPESVRTSDLDQLSALLGAAHTVDRIEGVLATQIVDPAWKFQLLHLRKPTEGKRISPQQWHEHVQQYLETELGAISNPLHHPRQAVNRAMAAIRGQAYSLAVPTQGRKYAVIEGRSLVSDVHGWFSSESVFLASGPPPGRTRELLAMIEAGVVELLGPEGEITTDDLTGEFVAYSPITGATVRARHCAQARMAKGHVQRTGDPLLRELLADGAARVHTVGRVGALSSAIETTPDTLHLVRSDGQVEERVVVLGIPASISQPGSGIGAAPGRPSPLLAGADVAARHILASAQTRANQLLRNNSQLTVGDSVKSTAERAAVS